MSQKPDGIVEFLGDLEIPISTRMDEKLYSFLYGHKKHSAEYMKNGVVSDTLMYIHLDNLALKYRALIGVKDEECDLAYWQRQDYTIGVCMRETVKSFLINNRNIHNTKYSEPSLFQKACKLFGLLLLASILVSFLYLSLQYANEVKSCYIQQSGNTHISMTQNPKESVSQLIVCSALEYPSVSTLGSQWSCAIVAIMTWLVSLIGI